MSTNRDDFIIAIRSALLKKGNRQKFSLFTLLTASCLILSLEYFKTGPIDKFRSITKDIIYRASYVVSIPFKLIEDSYVKIQDHINMYDEYRLLKEKEFNISSLENDLKFYKSENIKLRKFINEEPLKEGKYIITKVLIDKESPYIKSLIINKGFEAGIEKGMAALDRSYMIGKVIETNYLSSRILLVNDLNSKIPVIIEPGNTQAILNGSGSNYGELEYLPKNNIVDTGHIVYTSGSDRIFLSGIPIGKIEVIEGIKKVMFFSDLTQLDFVKIRYIK
ncbi:MAG: rod shape-determining protein MreC [Candidatus Pelagibacter sp.]|jgi:rod shape-determining protein MreC|nr:rod shape-determining protein MreC [Candidatus Pelagibacter sp.]